MIFKQPTQYCIEIEQLTNTTNNHQNFVAVLHVTANKRKLNESYFGMSKETKESNEYGNNQI